MLNAEIKELIEKNLPAQTSGVLREYLEKAESAIERQERLKKDLAISRDKGHARDKEISRLSAQLQPQAEVENAKIAVQKRELELAKTILTIQLEESEKRADAITHLVETVFKNRKLTINKSSNFPVAVDGGGGCAGFVTNASGGSLETREEL